MILSVREHEEARRALGRLGEGSVARDLRRAGWRVIAQRVSIGGVEVDLVLRKRSRVAIVEVKTRRARPGCRPEEGLRPEQRSRLLRASNTLQNSQGRILSPAQRGRLPRELQSVELFVAAVLLGAHTEEPIEIRYFRIEAEA